MQTSDYPGDPGGSPKNAKNPLWVGEIKMIHHAIKQIFSKKNGSTGCMF
jgi:hypothetical protein